MWGSRLGCVWEGGCRGIYDCHPPGGSRGGCPTLADYSLSRRMALAWVISHPKAPDPENTPARGNTARVAGLLYLLAGGSGFFSFMYVPNTLIVRGDASATARRLLATDMLFRFGIVAELISSVAFIFLVLTLYRLLAFVDRTRALVMVILVLVAIPVVLLDAVNQVAALTLIRGADFLSVFDRAELEALGMLFLRLHGAGLFIAQIFWGLWLIPFGLLVMRSGFIPRILGILLIAN